MSSYVTFLDTQVATQVITDLYIAALCVLAIIYVGLNRLSIIPLIITFTNCVGIFLGWWNWTPKADGTIRVNTATLFINYLFYISGEWIVVMYGYFIVDKLLPKHSTIMNRKTFMWIFWPLQILHLAVRIACVIFATVAYVRTGNSDATGPLYDIVQTQFILLAIIEILTAYILISIFWNSRKTAIRFLGGKRLGLLKHMLLSTELRVASLATIGITRASLEQPKRYHHEAFQVDAIAVNLINLFPMLLVLDLVLRRAMRMEVELQERIEKDEEEKGGMGMIGMGGAKGANAQKNPASLVISESGTLSNHSG